jgi:outer membrane protein TolC
VDPGASAQAVVANRGAAILINDALNGNNACYLAYSRAYNTLYLVNDAGTALLPGLTLNGSGTLSNSQCTITGAGSSANGGGNTLTLALNMTFPSGFAGNRIIYMAARSNGDALNSGWQAAGSVQ